jgi:hypothetical protein
MTQSKRIEWFETGAGEVNLEAKQSMISEDIDDIKVSVASISYYMYRLANCPYGDNLIGLNAWLDIQKEAFEKLADPTGKDDANP